MNTKTKIKHITAIVAAWKSSQAAANAAIDAGCLMIDGKLINATDKALEVAIDAFSEAIGDDDKWIWWFLLENKCGERAMRVSDDNRRKIKIRTVAQLVAVMEGRKP